MQLQRFRFLLSYCTVKHRVSLFRQLEKEQLAYLARTNLNKGQRDFVRIDLDLRPFAVEMVLELVLGERDYW